MLTKNDLYQIEQRVDEIEAILLLCDDKFDSDVIENLSYELDNIMLRLSEENDGGYT